MMIYAITSSPLHRASLSLVLPRRSLTSPRRTLMDSLRSSPSPSLSSNYITLLEHLTTMPTSPHELNSWWCATPIALRAPKSSSSKKRKAEEAVHDGSTGVFDSSSEDEPEPEQKLSSSASKKLLPPLLSLPAHRKVFQSAFLSLLSLPMEEVEQKRVLVILHRQVLGNLIEPRRCMDWLVDCGERGGTVGILALNGLFTLMQKHNLCVGLALSIDFGADALPTHSVPLASLLTHRLPITSPSHSMASLPSSALLLASPASPSCSSLTWVLTPSHLAASSPTSSPSFTPSSTAIYCM